MRYGNANINESAGKTVDDVKEDPTWDGQTREVKKCFR